MAMLCGIFLIIAGRRAALALESRFRVAASNPTTQVWISLKINEDGALHLDFPFVRLSDYKFPHAAQETDRAIRTPGEDSAE